MASEYLKHAQESWLARCTLNGVNASDFVDVTTSIERWDDWCKAWSERAAIHEEMGRAALSSRKYVSAAEHLCRAAVTYHFGEYVFVHDMAQQRAAHDKAVACHTLALPYMDPPGTRVLIPYQNTQIPAILRKPRDTKGQAPVVLLTMGLDSTTEELINFENVYLTRGMATLAFEGPGQGELQYELPIRYDYENVVGPVVDWIIKRADLDGNRVGISGISLGGYYAPRTVAFEKRIKACIANGGPYDWGALWETLPGLTKDAFRVRSHSANDSQARERAKLLTLEGVANRIECPLFVIAGGLDKVCPPEDAKRLAAEAQGPVELLVIEDGHHVAHNRPYRHRPQSADWMAEQLGIQYR